MTAQTDKPKKVIILDTSAFLAGFDPFSLGIEQVTVPLVEEEIKRNTMIKFRFETAVESGKVKIEAPSQETQNRVQASASKVGDSFKLSGTDLQLLSLALQFKELGCSPQIITDDYSIQNVAFQLGIEFSALATFGIKRLIEWKKYCPACHKEYPINSKNRKCQVCGTELKRKPRKTLENVK